MTVPDRPAPPGGIPYPHKRNDCEMCRERDADVHVLGDEFNQPGKRPLLLCQHCAGQFVALQAMLSRGAGLDVKPVTLTFEVAPGRLDAAGGDAR